MCYLVWYLLHGASNVTHLDAATLEDTMECPKCKGLMMLERFSDFFLIFYAWKCVNCGAIIDRTISMNRRKSLATREAQPVASR